MEHPDLAEKYGMFFPFTTVIGGRLRFLSLLRAE